MSMRMQKNTHFVFKNGVIIYDDYLFLHQENSAQRQFAYLTGDVKLSQHEIDKFNRNIELNESLAIQQGFKYKHIVFPSKPFVYREKFKKASVELCSIFSKYHQGTNVLFPELKEDDYDQDDTHTNDLGMVKVLNHIFPSLSLAPLPEALFQSVYTVGDLGVMCGREPTLKHRLIGFKGEWLNNTSKIEKFSLELALSGNTGHVDYIVNPYARHNLRVVLFGDSFFRSRLHIFERIFSEVIYFRRPYVMDEIAKLVKPDIVLTGNAERYLVEVPDARQPRPWFLNYLSSRFDSSKVPQKTLDAFEVLFSGRDSIPFKQFISSRTCTVKNYINRLEDIKLDDIKTQVDIDWLRDMAIQYENSDVRIAHKLMTLAHQARPEGPYIKEKLMEYARLM